ncbi:santalene and bergamotene synthase, chloroplastic isoform X1 [Solanum lycopersicum]|uniref:santalene and bergamotene synthase, chloroplastic isoform X1 n=1 Tax=Solanum lycopersicum TaxID=4081 RepID=UPI003749464D
MIIGYRINFRPLSHDKLRSHVMWQRQCSYNTASSMDGFEEAKERIRESFSKVELSPSSYDTAWVAMVPSKYSLNEPCFPQCLDWIIENQREDGSWGLNPTHPLLLKDSLSSTLACLLALTKWRVGDEQIKRGLGFIETQSWAIDNKDQISPLGFEIIFPSMIKSAEKLNLNLAMNKIDSTIKRALQNEFTRNIEYMGEGVGELCDWKEIIKLHQRQNGSLFDSPATTAAALIYHQHDQKCYEYINSILQQHKNWVPTMYPTKIHSLLCLVDTLQNLGVHRHFKSEIKKALEEIYRLWQQKNEEIFSNVTHCAMAFRLLRMSYYNVSSDELAEFVDEEHFFSTSGKFISDVAIIELHKASQLTINEKDDILDKINNWTGIFMQQKLLNNDFLDIKSKKEVELALRMFYVTYDRAENRRYIESYQENNFKMLKTAYRCGSMNNIDLLTFSMQEFELGLSQYQEEVEQLKRWYEDYRLEQVGLAQEYIYRTHLISVAVFFEHELSNARIMYAKYAMFLTLSDDLFEHLASKDELLNIIELVQRWDEHTNVGFHSEKVKLFFTALYDTIEEVATNAQIKQGRNVKHHIIELFVEGLNSMLVDRVEWGTRIPSIEEYLRVSLSTFGGKCMVLTSQYVVGIHLCNYQSDDEIQDLCYCSGIVMRLLNDLQSFKRERSDSRLVNMVKLVMKQRSGTICEEEEEEAIKHIKETIECNRRKLLRMVLQSKGKGSKVPQALKDLFWRTTKAVYFFYSDHDEFRSPNKVKHHINQVIYKPLHNR